MMKTKDYAILSIAAALLTIGLKVAAFFVTDSVGLLSDALESGINLFTALFALITLTISAWPPDDEHAYGHYKAEYFSSGAVGTLIAIAGIAIVISAVVRFLSPREMQSLDLGLILSTLAGIINLVVARVLLRAGKQHHSVALEAEARHLLADVWTTLGVLVGLVLAQWTQWHYFDPLIALMVGLNIIFYGIRLIRQATDGLMDSALDPAEVSRIEAVLEQYAEQGVQYHALRTRRSGARRFVSMHVQLPGEWTVQAGHDLLEKIEAEIRETLPRAAVFTHMEPVEDPVSWEDLDFDRDGPPDAKLKAQ